MYGRRRAKPTAWACPDRPAAERRHEADGLRAKRRARSCTGVPAAAGLSGGKSWPRGAGSSRSRAAEDRGRRRPPFPWRCSAPRQACESARRPPAGEAHPAACCRLCCCTWSAIARSRSASSSSTVGSRRSTLARTVGEASGRTSRAALRRRSRCRQSVTSSRRRVPLLPFAHLTGPGVPRRQGGLGAGAEAGEEQRILPVGCGPQALATLPLRAQARTRAGWGRYTCQAGCCHAHSANASSSPPVGSSTTATDSCSVPSAWRPAKRSTPRTSARSSPDV